MFNPSSLTNGVRSDRQMQTHPVMTRHDCPHLAVWLPRRFMKPAAIFIQKFVLSQRADYFTLQSDAGTACVLPIAHAGPYAHPIPWQRGCQHRGQQLPAGT